MKITSRNVIDSINYRENIDEILIKISGLIDSTIINIKKISLDKCGTWVYSKNTGLIHNEDYSFFQIGAISRKNSHKSHEQPIIIQNEIGYLGIIASVINNRLMFLLQFKIEPGNINCIQVSPTIQATWSNFNQKHGGTKPAFIDFFKNIPFSNIIYDQLQSEQGERFYKKRNRNIIVFLENEIEVPNTHYWFSLGQIYELLKHDNLINMDTRSVLSGFPFFKFINHDDALKSFEDKNRVNSMFGKVDSMNIQKAYSMINDYKMNSSEVIELIKLSELANWNQTDIEIKHKIFWPFKIIFCDIEIEGREVKKWSQPLLESNEIATIGLLTKIIDGSEKLLCKITSEIGSFDKCELGPSLVSSCNHTDQEDEVFRFFLEKLQSKEGILVDLLLSEEGGRFYHEQNRNIIVKCSSNDLDVIPFNYIWLDIKDVTFLISHFNVVNIQLRNLVTLLEVK